MIDEIIAGEERDERKTMRVIETVMVVITDKTAVFCFGASLIPIVIVDEVPCLLIH
jgi:hypothetical protein